MPKVLIFFCCACCILVLTIINLGVDPNINKKLGDLGVSNCQALIDIYDDIKSGLDDKGKKAYTVEIDKCKNMKGMYNMEYTSFVFNIVIGFTCGFLGLLHLLDIKKELVTKTGLIGVGCGFVGFILSFVYSIENWIVFTFHYSSQYKRDERGVYAEKVSGTSNDYKCLYYDDSGDILSVHAQFCEFTGKQYNYDKDLYKNVDPSCVNNDYPDNCAYAETVTANIPSTCDYIYANQITSITNRDIFDRFLTTLLLSLIVCLADIGLAIFGFMLFKFP